MENETAKIGPESPEEILREKFENAIRNAFAPRYGESPINKLASIIWTAKKPSEATREEIRAARSAIDDIETRFSDFLPREGRSLSGNPIASLLHDGEKWVERAIEAMLKS